MSRSIRFLSSCLFLVGAVLVGCSGGGDRQGAAESEGGWSAAAEIDRYTVRGEIVSMPGPDSSFNVHHEAIPEFRSLDGEVVGMGAMTMPFLLADGLSVEGLSVGDKVELTLEVNRDPDATPLQRVTRVRRLPADTVLDFGEAMGEADPDSAHEGH